MTKTSCSFFFFSASWFGIELLIILLHPSPFTQRKAPSIKYHHTRISAMLSLEQQLQQPQQGNSSEIPPAHRQHPMQGLTIETSAQKSDLDSSSSARSSLQSSSDDDESSHDLQDYDLDTTVAAWDQLTDLTHEITSSLMAKQASILCQRFRRESSNLEAGPPVKKRIVLLPPLPNPVPVNDVASTDLDVTVVTNDEHSSSHLQIDMNATENPTIGSQEEGGLPKTLYEHVDRIGRMSRLVMEIEFCQKELRKEMLAMKEHDDKA
jgi:hypothetical protein